LNILVLYDDRSTHVSTIFEHLSAFRSHSEHEVYYLPATGQWPELVDRRLPGGWAFDWFDAVVLHYSVRLSTEHHLASRLATALSDYDGPKIAFVQDDYEAVETTRKAIERLRFDVVFTSVRAQDLETVYPRARFPSVRFIETLTGFVPERADFEALARPMSERARHVVYRGRDLPYHYGHLGRQKSAIGIAVKKRALARNIPIDIEVTSRFRIYGDDWYHFLASGRATLATESGCNVLDCDGSLAALSKQHAALPYEEFHTRFLAVHENSVRMNQISPKVFEAIRLRTALILLEGEYSGILQPETHYMPLRADYSNLDDLLGRLDDVAYLERLTERAFGDVVGSGRYSFAAFIATFDRIVGELCTGQPRAELLAVPMLRRCTHEDNYQVALSDLRLDPLLSTGVLRGPHRRERIAGMLSGASSELARSAPLRIARWSRSAAGRMANAVWRGLPQAFRRRLEPLLRRVLPARLRQWLARRMFEQGGAR
jgi:hypothetical protein